MKVILKPEGVIPVHRDLILCHGCFDMLHIGHVRHLEAAKHMHGTLFVSVTPDKWVNKGDGRPVFNEEQRVEMLAALRCVDFVAVNLWPTAVETIKLLQPRWYVKGKEYRDKMTPALAEEQQAVESVGGKLCFTDVEEFHTTELLKKHANKLDRGRPGSVRARDRGPVPGQADQVTDPLIGRQ